MARPKIKLRLNLPDILLECIGGLIIILLLIYPLYHYPNLPEQIPVHYDATGNADRFGSKSDIWFMPVLGLMLYLGLAILNRFPHIFNYMVEITEDNAHFQYQLVTRLMRIINVLIAGLFFYITYQQIQSAQHGGEGLGIWFLPCVLIGSIGPVIWHLVKSSKNG